MKSDVVKCVVLNAEQDFQKVETKEEEEEEDANTAANQVTDLEGHVIAQIEKIRKFFNSTIVVNCQYMANPEYVFKVNDLVYGNFKQQGKWLPGKITKAIEGGLFIEYIIFTRSELIVIIKKRKIRYYL